MLFVIYLLGYTFDELTIVAGENYTAAFTFSHRNHRKAQIHNDRPKKVYFFFEKYLYTVTG